MQAKKHYLRNPPTPRRTKNTPDNRVNRHRKQQVEEDAWQKRVEQHHLRRGVLSQHVAQNECPERVEDRDDEDREERRVAAVASRRLAVPADPIAREREQK